MSETSLTRQQLVTSARISHNSLERYIELGDVVLAKDSTSHRVMYDPVSIDNILHRKQTLLDSASEFVTRSEILSTAKISESYFGRYLKSGDIVKAPESLGLKGLYERVSIDNVLRRKAEVPIRKQGAKRVKNPKPATPTVDDLSKALATLSKKMLDRITHLEERVADLENRTDPHSQTY